MLFASAFLAVMNAPKGSRTDGLLVHAKRVFPCVFHGRGTLVRVGREHRAKPHFTAS